MPSAITSTLQPRKTPVQARSAATVDAILQATIQVLLAVGKERLTTTAVAARAGCSVGTLYQYFPHKAALLQAVLQQHMAAAGSRLESAFRALHGLPAPAMGAAAAQAYFAVKLQQPAIGAALYAVAADVDGVAIARVKTARIRRALQAMLRTASTPLPADPSTVAAVLQSTIAGALRGIHEQPTSARNSSVLCEQVQQMLAAYLASGHVAPSAASRRSRPS